MKKRFGGCWSRHPERKRQSGSDRGTSRLSFRTFARSLASARDDSSFFQLYILSDPMQSQVPRWRWWIHFLLIGGYFFPGLTPYPLLRHSGQGFLIVCRLNLVIFTIVFLLGWLASRTTADELLLRWRPG